MGHETSSGLQSVNKSLPAWVRTLTCPKPYTSGPIWDGTASPRQPCGPQMCLPYFPQCPHLLSSQSWQGQAQGNEETGQAREQGLAPRPRWASLNPDKCSPLPSPSYSLHPEEERQGLDSEAQMKGAAPSQGPTG